MICKLLQNTPFEMEIVIRFNKLGASIETAKSEMSTIFGELSVDGEEYLFLKKVPVNSKNSDFEDEK